MITNAIARRYAKALVQLAAEAGTVDKTSGELVQIDALLSANPELRSVLGNPAYGIEAKREILKELCEKLALSDLVKNCIFLLLERNRLSFLPQIAESYGVFADELSGVIRPTLVTGIPLDDGQVGQIKDALAKATGKKVVMKVEVDPALIGGVVKKIGDTVFDGSVKTQLSRIEDILQKG